MSRDQWWLALVGAMAAGWSSPSGVTAVYQNQSQTYGCNTGKFYEFAWEDVYSLDRKMPQGCSCAAGGVSDSNCKVFDCDCTCDLSAGLCDYNCCCDPDCTDVEVSRFQDSEVGCILHEEEPDFQKCYNAEKVNERYPMTYTGTTKDAIDQLLCVAVDNSDVKGTYYDDPGSFEDDSTIFDDSQGQKDYAYTSFIPGSASNRGTSTVRTILDRLQSAVALLHLRPFSVPHVHARANSLYQFCPFRAASLLPSCSRSPSLLLSFSPSLSSLSTPWSLFLSYFHRFAV